MEKSKNKVSVSVGKVNEGGGGVPLGKEKNWKANGAEHPEWARRLIAELATKTARRGGRAKELGRIRARLQRGGAQGNAHTFTNPSRVPAYRFILYLDDMIFVIGPVPAAQQWGLQNLSMEGE